MSQGNYGTDAEQHRQQAAATEVHAKHHHEKHKHSGSGSDATDPEATFFTRHRTPLAAAVLIVVAIIFFTVVLTGLRV